ncbi:MAG: hypothetical protein HXS48_10965 [Theionarchaea archaeon]|nr:hypothetical protein [Theionarchaea archaeon]
MHTEHIVIISSLALAGLTAVYVLLTHRILKEQRKSAELTVIPDISFHFDKRKPKIGLNCIVKEKSIHNLTAEISIDEISKESKFLGNVIIRKQQTYNNSLFFDFTKHLQRLREKNFTLGVKVSYESRSGSKIVELFTWKASMDSEGNLDLDENYPDNRELLLAPWI